MSVLSELLRTKAIPWAEQDASQRIIIPRPEMSATRVPPGVRLSPRKRSSRRVVVKGRRHYNNTRNIIAEWPQDGLQELNTHVLICVLNGHIGYQLGDYTLHCGPGHFICVAPGTPRPDGSRTYVDLQKSATCDIVTFLLHPSAVQCWISHAHAGGRDISDDCLILHDRVVSLFRMLMAEMGEGAASPHGVPEKLLALFLTMLQRELDAGNVQHLRFAQRKDQRRTDAMDAPQTDFATRLEHHVLANLHRSLKLENVAREMYLSPAQFSRNVRRETGQSFNQFLARHRLEEARTLLRASEWTISAIAGVVGFRSPRYFCAFFKLHTGQTPTEYRSRGASLDTHPQE